MAHKPVKTAEQPRENPQEQLAEAKKAPARPAELPPQVREIVAAEEREEQEVIERTREALAQLSSRLPLQKISSEQKLERFTA